MQCLFVEIEEVTDNRLPDWEMEATVTIDPSYNRSTKGFTHFRKSAIVNLNFYQLISERCPELCERQVSVDSK